MSEHGWPEAQQQHRDGKCGGPGVCLFCTIGKAKPSPTPPGPPSAGRYLDVVMTCLPGPNGEFVELEDEHGRGVGKPHEWIDRGNGLYALRIYMEK